MLQPVNQSNLPLFQAACAHERVMGSKCRNSFDIYGGGTPDMQFLVDITESGHPAAALFLSGRTLLIPNDGNADADEIVQFIEENRVTEVDTSLSLAEMLMERLGGTLESSFYMEYAKPEPPTGNFSGILPCDSLEDAYSVLQQSHEYYRTHLTFDTWSTDIAKRIQSGYTELYLLRDDSGKPIGTGSIISSDEECGVLAAIAVIPACRGQKLGTRISGMLTAHVMAQGKTPRLISGYDAVADLYNSIGYRKIGRWGEWYRAAL